MSGKIVSMIRDTASPGKLGLAVLAIFILSCLTIVGFAKPAAAAEVNWWISCGTRNEIFYGGDGNNYRFPAGGFCLTGGSNKLIFQGDGNLVFYSNNVNHIWSSGTYNRPNAKLVLQNDGNLVIYDNGRAVYASSTYRGAPGVPGGPKRLLMVGNSANTPYCVPFVWACTNDLAILSYMDSYAWPNVLGWQKTPFFVNQ